MTNTERRINVKGLLKHFGGAAALHQILGEHGVKVSAKAVEAWGTRNSIPANRLALLEEIGTKIGAPFFIGDFFEEV